MTSPPDQKATNLYVNVILFIENKLLHSKNERRQKEKKQEKQEGFNNLLVDYKNS